MTEFTSPSTVPGAAEASQCLTVADCVAHGCVNEWDCMNVKQAAAGKAQLAVVKTYVFTKWRFTKQ